MEFGAVMIIMIIGGFLILTFYVIGIYNKILDARNRVEDQFEQIDVELMKKISLIPNLVEIVKKYAKHEKKILSEIIEVKNKMLNVKGINEKIKVFNNVNNVLNKLVLITDSYSELKIDTTFKKLKKDLIDTENKIDYASSFYNDTALWYNNLINQFPSSIVAKIFKFKNFEYFKD